MPNAPAAVVFMLAASALVAATSLIAKALGTGPDGLNPIQITAGRFVFAFATLVCVVALTPQRWPSFQNVPWLLHGLRVLCGFTGVTLTFAAVAVMPVAEATALSFLSPLVAMGLAVAVLSESLSARKLVAAGLALFGALLVLRPGTEAFQPAGLLALGAALAMGVETIIIKRLSDTEPALRILLINNALGTLLSLSVLIGVWHMPTGAEWGLLVAVGVVMVTAQSCFIQSMKRGDASFVMPVFYSVLAFAALYDALLYGVVPVPFSIGGAIAIVCAALILAGGEAQKARPGERSAPR